MTSSSHGIVHDLRTCSPSASPTCTWLGAAIAAYAVLEGVEAVGLWFGKRWAEYLTFVATIVFVPYEIDELIKSVTALKVVALVINLAVAVYLLYAKRLFGLRGGGKAERAEHEADIGWPAIERATPGTTPERQSYQPSQSEPRAASTCGLGSRRRAARAPAGQRWRCRRRPGPRE